MAGLSYEEKRIQGLDFQLSMLPARSALEQFHKTVRICGPGLPELLRQIAKPGGVRDTMAVGGAVFAALARAETPDVMDLQKVLLEPCRVKQDGKWVQLSDVYDVVLQGKIWGQLNLLLWAVQLNFADFFNELKSAAETARADAAALQASPST